MGGGVYACLPRPWRVGGGCYISHENCHTFTNGEGLLKLTMNSQRGNLKFYGVFSVKPSPPFLEILNCPFSNELSVYVSLPVRQFNEVSHYVFAHIVGGVSMVSVYIFNSEQKAKTRLLDGSSLSKSVL